MVQRGSLVEFKSGLFGIDKPKNLGIVIGRVTRKKEVSFQIFTIKGIYTLKKQQLTNRKFDTDLKIPKIPLKKLNKELKPRLEFYIQNYSKSKPTKTKRGQKEVEIQKRSNLPDNDYDIWIWILKKKDAMKKRSTSTIATEWLGEHPSHDEFKEFEKILGASWRQGVGYFDVEEVGKKQFWTPISQEMHDAILLEIKALERLRERMIEVDQIVDKEGYENTINIPVALSVLDFTEQENQLLSKINQWMEMIILDKKLEGDNLLGGTHIHKAGKFSLYRYLRFLAEDWTETRYILQTASAMTEFLFKTEYWSETQALESVAIRAVAENEFFSWDVNERIEKLAVELPEPTEEPEELESRYDLTELEAYTVDPATARDFDQALSYKKNEDGSWTLWVHVADVTHYSTVDSEFDKYAKQRATAVYLPPRGLPMHPPALSTGLCALQENKLRFALTIKIEYTSDGKRTDYEIYESVINVRKNLSYAFVDEQLQKGESYWTGMLELGNILRKNFPGLDVETAEARMNTSAADLTLDVEKSSESILMNEMFMIAANEAIGEFLRDSEHPSLYRCHPLPDKEDVEKFNDQMKALGIDYFIEIPEWPEIQPEEGEDNTDNSEDSSNLLDMLKSGGKMSFTDGMLFSMDSKDSESESEEKGESEVEPIMKGLAQLPVEERDKWMEPFKNVLARIKKVEDEDSRMVMHLTTLGMFGRAFYTKDNIGHFGLGSRCYTHFTAPIRRYSDNIVHRILKSILRKTADVENPIYTKEDLDELASHCTDQTISAEKLERRIVGVGLTLMTRRDEWKGKLKSIVVKIMPHRCFVLIREVIDGRINMSDITREEVIVDPAQSIAFKKMRDDAVLREITKASDWLEMLNDDGEFVELLLRLGQKLNVKITARDYVEGNVVLKLI